MKRIYLLCILGAICFLLTSCGTKESATDSIVTESPIIEPTLESEPILSPSPTIEMDHFIGEYMDSETNQPALQIQKDEDGYWVEMEVLGKYYMPCCLCELVDDKLQFDLAAQRVFMTGTIAVEDGIATVTFLKSCWGVVNRGDTFTYHKISNIPYEQFNERKKNSPSPTIETDHFIGEYMDSETNQPGLGLQIQKDEDGYWVEMEVLGKYHVPCCLSEVVDGKIEFSAWYKRDYMDGTVTEKDGIATVTFLQDCWDVVHAGDTFVYHKLSDIPYQQYNEWIKNNPSPSPIIKEEDFVGEYFEDTINWPNLEIERKEDGTFLVDFEIWKVYSIDPCVGKFVDDAIEFTFEDEESKELMKGTITLEDGYAVLTIKSDYWKNIDKTDTYFYYKVYDIPYYSKNNDEISEE